MQTDVDTIIVHTKLEPVRKQLNDLVLEINIIRGTIIKESSIKLRPSKEDEQFYKLVKVTLNSITEMAIHEFVCRRQNQTKKSIGNFGQFSVGLHWGSLSSGP